MTCGRGHKRWVRASTVRSSEWIALLIWIWMAGRKIFEEVDRRARLIFLFYFRKKTLPNKWSFFKPPNNVANERCIVAGFGKDKFLTISHLGGGDLSSKGSKTTHERRSPPKGKAVLPLAIHQRVERCSSEKFCEKSYTNCLAPACSSIIGGPKPLSLSYGEERYEKVRLWCSRKKNCTPEVFICI